MSAKPAYDRLHALIKGKWWTKTEGRTNANGEFATRAFLGTHRLTAQLPGGHAVTKEVHWARGAANRFEITVS